jgi:catechol 2,3-dioxygenase-like lactoylglutathione lyase family enzyme
MAETPTLEMVTFSRPNMPEAAIVRVIVAPGATPPARPDYNAEIVGPLGMGVPVRDLNRWDGIVTRYGFRSQVGVTSMAFPRADQTTYVVGETHYLAPDDILVLGVDRAEMRPVGPIDPALDIGGPAYVSAVISDAAKLAPFFREVLGYEMRRQTTFESRGPQGGMRLPAGTQVLFQQWYAPGARTGYLVIMDLLNAGRSPSAPLGPRSRGVAMWSFETRSLAAIERRIAASGTRVLSAPARIDSPGIGPVRSVIVETPDGFPVEVYQRLGR